MSQWYGKIQETLIGIDYSVGNETYGHIYLFINLKFRSSVENLQYFKIQW